MKRTYFTVYRYYIDGQGDDDEMVLMAKTDNVTDALAIIQGMSEKPWEKLDIQHYQSDEKPLPELVLRDSQGRIFVIRREDSYYSYRPAYRSWYYGDDDYDPWYDDYWYEPTQYQDPYKMPMPFMDISALVRSYMPQPVYFYSADTKNTWYIGALKEIK